MNKTENLAILAEIRKLARNLPGGQRDAIINKCNRVQMLLDKGRQIPGITPEEETAVHENQRQQIHAWMLSGKTITSKQAFEQFGITRLSAVIMQIEKATGKAPGRRRIVVPTRLGKNVSVCEYYLEPEN
jgi:hypothetical protein